MISNDRFEQKKCFYYLRQAANKQQLIFCSFLLDRYIPQPFFKFSGASKKQQKNHSPVFEPSKQDDAKFLHILVHPTPIFLYELPYPNLDKSD